MDMKKHVGNNNKVFLLLFALVFILSIYRGDIFE